MNKFKKWLIPVIVVCLLLATLVGCSSTPQSLGEIFDPSGNPFAHRFSDVKDIRTATFVVAASDSVHKYEADYRCSGTNDHVQIQAALDVLPATGGEVFLLDGTYNVEVTINLDTNQTLRGCGRNTILTTSTWLLLFLSAVGGSGTEKTGIVIADLQIYGAIDNRGDTGIYFEYVDYSFIQNVYSRGHMTGAFPNGIQLFNSDHNTITGNTCQGNLDGGIHLDTSSHNTVSSNTCQGNHWGIGLIASSDNTITGNTCQGNLANGAGEGISIYNSSNNTITGNTCQGNQYGIYLTTSSSNNTITGNTCRGSYEYGISLANTCNNNTIIGNHLTENSQTTNNSYADIYLSASDYNNIQGNTCRSSSIATTLVGAHGIGETELTLVSSVGFWIDGGITIDPGGGNEETHKIVNIVGNVVTMDAGLTNNQPNLEEVIIPRTRYGININTDTCNENLVINNDLYDDGFGTAPFNDSGTDTKLPSITVPFSDGSEAQDSGYLIDLAGEYARALLFLNKEVVQVVRIKVYARAVPAEAGAMRAEFVIYGGADNEAYTTHNGSVANHPSTSSNFAADDVIYWTITEAGVLALLGGDSVEIKVLHEAVGDGDIDTQAYFRTVTIEYV